MLLIPFKANQRRNGFVLEIVSYFCPHERAVLETLPAVCIETVEVTQFAAETR